MTPSRPISARWGIISEGKCEASSHSITWGAISVSANSRTVRRSCCCSSVREKSTGARAQLPSQAALARVVRRQARVHLYHARCSARNGLWREGHGAKGLPQPADFVVLAQQLPALERDGHVAVLPEGVVQGLQVELASLPGARIGDEFEDLQFADLVADGLAGIAREERGFLPRGGFVHGHRGR